MLYLIGVEGAIYDVLDTWHNKHLYITAGECICKNVLGVVTPSFYSCFTKREIQIAENLDLISVDDGLSRIKSLSYEMDKRCWAGTKVSTDYVHVENIISILIRCLARNEKTCMVIKDDILTMYFVNSMWSFRILDREKFEKVRTKAILMGVEYDK